MLSKFSALVALSSFYHGACGNPILNESSSPYTGKATNWGGNWKGGNCGFSTWPEPSGLPEIAIAGNLCNSGEYCGACLEVTCREGQTKIGIVGDQCPSCTSNGLDLDPTLWAAVTNNASPSVKDITWRVVDCGFSAPIKLINKEGVSANWFSMQVAGANNPVKSLDISTDGGSTWTETTRQSSDNFFQPSKAAQGTSGQIKVTCANGKVVITKDVSFTSGTIQEGSGNC